MAPRNYDPYRKCDFCNASNYPSYHTRYERRAWTLHCASNKMTCPNCRKKGEETERLAIAEKVRHRREMERIDAVCDPVPPCCAFEPPAAYGFGVPGNYRRIKDQYPDAVLLFRIGDWYVALNEDADTVSRELGTAMHRFPPLTTRSTEFHFGALEQHLPKLVRAGYRVAICDRTEAPSAEPHRHREERGPALYGTEHDLSQVAEPPGDHRAKKAARYLKNERTRVVDRLEDVIGVFLRHKALPDYTGLSEWQTHQEDDRARKALQQNIEAIRMELGLRRVWIGHHGGLIMPLGNCWCKLLPEQLPAVLKTARRHFSGKDFQEGLPRPGSAPPWAIGDFMDEERAAFALACAEENVRVALSCSEPSVRKHWLAHLEKVKELIEHPHNYAKRQRRPSWAADDDDAPAPAEPPSDAYDQAA